MEFEPRIRITEREEDMIINLRLLPAETFEAFERGIRAAAEYDARQPGVVHLFFARREPPEGRVFAHVFRIVLPPEEKEKLFSSRPPNPRRGPAAPPQTPENFNDK